MWTCLSWSVCCITDHLANGEQVTLDDLSSSLCTNGVTLLQEEKTPNGQTDAAGGAINASKPSHGDKIHFNSVWLKLPVDHQQLHRKSQMQTEKTLHPPAAPEPPWVMTQWRRHQPAAAGSWTLLARRSKTRPTTHVRPLKDPDWCRAQYSRCWATLTSAFLLPFLVAVCASEPFIEINLEDAVQSEPSTAPPESSSSVLTFSSSLTSSLT